MRFTVLKRGYRLAELVLMHEPLAGCGGAAESRSGEVASILRETEHKTAIHNLTHSAPSSLIVSAVHMAQKWC
ncbi:Mobile element protein [Escherichia coli CE516]|nr:Mobile element protein [Escherichia coli CE516]